jgi:uncharacterized protein YndB with AHSA1/START domain
MSDIDHVTSALVVKRILPAPPAAVFAAWTDPALLGRWMSPYGDASATLDLRIGGGFTIVMHGLGQAIEHTGEYRAIEPPSRLVFTWESAYTGLAPSLVTVLLRPLGAGTELTLIHEQLPPGQVDSHRGGWGGILEHLDAYLRSAVLPLREA